MRIFELFKETAPDNSWRRAHPLKMLMAIGTDYQAIQKAQESAVAKGESRDKVMGLSRPIQIREVSQNNMWWYEKVSKATSILPIAAGLVFFNNAVNFLRNSHGPESIVAGVMGLAGLAAIALGPILAYRTGQAYGEMRQWMEDNGHETAQLGLMTNGRHRHS